LGSINSRKKTKAANFLPLQRILSLNSGQKQVKKCKNI